MKMHLTYIGLELKRASRQFPNLIFGAVMLAAMLGMIALLGGRMLYGDRAAEQIEVGVILPEEDALAKKAMQMITSLESVEASCRFRYMRREEAEQELEQGKLYAVLEVPEGLVQNIMNGTNTPVKIRFSEDAGVESRLFRELTDAGARTLGAAQAGIYAGDELLDLHGMSSRRPELEADLNRVFLSYSLPRSDYFRTFRVSATGDVSTMTFYGISMFVLYLLLMVIPISGYLTPQNVAMRRQLSLAGIGRTACTAARILGMGMLLFAAAILAAAGMQLIGAVAQSEDAGIISEWLALAEGPAGWLQSVAVLAGICLGVAVLAVCIYQLAGNLMSGVMLLFLVVIGQHFLAGGFLPQVFLPDAVRNVAAWMPSTILMDAVKLIATSSFRWPIIGKLILWIAAGACVAILADGREP